MHAEPTARVQFTGSEGSDQRLELGFRLLVLADLAPGYEAAPVRVDKSSFGALLERLAPSLSLTVPNRLGSGDKDLECRLTFTSLRSFHPDGIAAAVPVLAGLVGARAALHGCLERTTTWAEVRPKIAAAFAGTALESLLAAPAAGPTPTTGGAGGGLDALLDQVDLPTAVASYSGASLADLLTAAVTPVEGAGGEPPQRLKGLVAEIDARLSRQVAAISAAPAFEALEQAWRGLKLLVDRVDFRAGVTLDVLPASKADFLSAFYEECFTAEYEGTSPTPLDLVLADVAVDRSPKDLQTVQQAAQMAGSLSIPFVLAMSPEYWGVRQAKLIGTLPDLMEKARGSEYAKWNTFRSDDASLWLCLTANRFVLRPDWAEAAQPATSFTWSAEPGKPGQPLWGSPVWAMGVAMAAAFADSGIRFPCAGREAPGRIDDLPLVPYPVARGEAFSLPLEVNLDDRKAFELKQCGFAALVGQPGSDSASFLNAPTFHQPARYDTKEATRASFLAATLPYQAFAGVAARLVQRLGHTLGSSLGEAEVKARFRAAMRALFATCEEQPADDEIEIEVTPAEGAPEQLEVAIRLKPAFTIYGGEVDLVVGTTLR